MKHQFVIAAGYRQIVLPDGHMYGAGDTVILTDDQWSALSTKFKNTVVTDHVVIDAPTDGNGGTSPDPQSLIRTVRVIERYVHHFSCMYAVAVTEGLAQSWVIAVPAEVTPLAMEIMMVGHLGVMPQVAQASLAVRKVASGSGDLESDTPPVTSYANSPVLTPHEDEDGVWTLVFDHVDSTNPAIETEPSKVWLVDAGWYRCVVRVRWAA